MEKYKFECDDTTTYIGTVEANSKEEAKKIIRDDPSKLKGVEPVIGETKIIWIKKI